MLSTKAFVGRHREMDILVRRLELAMAGNGNLVMLSGEAGVGKSRIALEFAELARRRGAMVLRGGCFEGEWQPPYALWVGLLEEEARKREQSWIQKKLGATAPALAELLPELLSGSRGGVLGSTLSPEEARFRLFDAAAQLLLALAEDTPLVLLLDDLQWADSDSLRLLRHTAHIMRRARVLLVGAFRYPELHIGPRHPLRDVLAKLQVETEYEQISVQGLGEKDIAEYLSQSCSVPPPAALVRSLSNETNGNPFYLREVLRHLRDKGEIPNGEGEWPAEFNPRRLGMAAGVSQIVDLRLSHVSEDTTQMLTQASGFTGGFDFPVLRILTGLTDDRLLDCLDEALQAGFLVGSTSQPVYSFAHSIVRQAIYGRLNPDRQVRLHRQIAASLLQLFAGREKENAAELAHQYHASRSLPGASAGIPYALEAARQSRARHAYDLAAGFLHMARDLSAESEAPERAEILQRLAVAEAEAFLLDEAGATVQQALRAMEDTSAPREQVAAFLARAAWALKEAGADPTAWENLVEKGLALAGEKHDLLWARLSLLRERIETAASGAMTFGRWLGHDPEAVAIARRDGNEIDYVGTLDSPEPRTQQESEEIFALARSWQRPSAMMAGMDIAARDLFYRHGAFAEAAIRYQELLAAAEQYGSIREQAEALSQLAMSRAILGELTEARRWAAMAHEKIERVGPAHGIHFMELALDVMLAYHLDGDWSELAARAYRFASSAAPGQPRHHLARVGLSTAAIDIYVQSKSGDRDGTLRRLAALTPLAESMAPTTFAHNSAITITAAAVWELEAVEYARRYQRMALQMIDAGVGNGPVGPHQLVIARMASLLGDVGMASEYFEKARNEAEMRGLRPGRAMADFDEAQMLLRSSATPSGRIVPLLNCAAEAFRSLGMEGWEKRAMSLKAIVETGAGPCQAAAPGDAAGQESSASQSKVSALSRREREVVQLLAMGFSNAEISEQLVISVRTAEAHVASILAKLGMSSRTQIVAWAASQGLAPTLQH